jgi:hypothetical protein
MTSVRVPDFSPKVNGFHFPNAFPKDPIATFRLGDIATLSIGDASKGLCGGMAYAVRDLHESRVPPPTAGLGPPGQGDPTFDYIVGRQIDSIDHGIVPLRFFKLMDPGRPAHESRLAEILGWFKIDRHSRTWTMVNLEWPAIRAELDGGQLSILGLVKVIGLDPKQLALNHQVVAYGYDLEATTVTLRIYDPNHPDDDEITLRFDTADARADIAPTWSEPNETVHCFFRAPYEQHDPAPFR